MHCCNQQDRASNVSSGGDTVYYACAMSAGMCLPICCLLSRQWLPDPMIVLDPSSEAWCFKPAAMRQGRAQTSKDLASVIVQNIFAKAELLVDYTPNLTLDNGILA